MNQNSREHNLLPLFLGFILILISFFFTGPLINAIIEEKGSGLKVRLSPTNVILIMFFLLTILRFVSTKKPEARWKRSGGSQNFNNFIDLDGSSRLLAQNELTTEN